MCGVHCIPRHNPVANDFYTALPGWIAQRAWNSLGQRAGCRAEDVIRIFSLSSLVQGNGSLEWRSLCCLDQHPMETMGNGLQSTTASGTEEPTDPRNRHSVVEWWREIECASRSVLMLDFDGTLAPFVRERMQARMYLGVAERLLRLASVPRTRLVLVSGRPARDFASLLPAELHLEIWGSHGREHIRADGRYSAIPLNQTQQECLAELEAELHRHDLGSVIEKKVGSVAIHTRGLAEADVERITAVARDFHCTLASRGTGDSGLELLPFDGGIELRGRGCSKATAVEKILHDEPPDAPAAYLGDDLTDEDAFVALDARGSEGPSLRVLVRPEPRPSAADLWLTPPDELLAFLDRWLAAVDAHEVRSEAP
jgi:trehalose-phosphatase